MNIINMQRRLLLGSMAGIAFASTGLVLAQQSKLIEVWKDPSCGCCKDWIAHIEKSGFRVTVHESGNNVVRAQLGLPKKLGSCHTALIQGYVIGRTLETTEEDLMNTVFPHPTLSEMMHESVLDAYGRVIHI